MKKYILNFIIFLFLILPSSFQSKRPHCPNDKVNWETVAPLYNKSTQPNIASEGVVDIKWSIFKDEYPRGNQDSAGTLYKGGLFSSGGFCGGPQFPYYCKGRGFYKDTYLYNFTTKTWEQLQDMPGLGRQGHKCETVDNQVYCFGGFSYSSPYSHVDAYKYNGSWHQLSNIPSNYTAATMICSMNRKIYMLESGWYDFTEFYVSDKLFEYDVDSDTWSHLSNLPGTPRWSTDITCIDGNIYVIGGVSGNDEMYNPDTNSNDANIYKTILDNWKYNIKSKSWERLSDTPLVLGNWMFQTYHKGYIFLIGGAGYMKVENKTEVSIPENMNIPHSKLNKNVANDYLFTNNVYVYDVGKDTFIHSTPLPYDWNGPTVWLVDDTLYLAAGELGLMCTEEDFFSRHPTLILKGKISFEKQHNITVYLFVVLGFICLLSFYVNT